MASMAAILRGYSIEIVPSDSKAVDAAIDRVPVGTEISLTWIPGSDPMSMIAPAAKLKKAGLVPVPHVGARHLESASQLELFSQRLTVEAGVDRILLVGGDRARPAGPYDSSLAVLQTGALQRSGIHRVAIAGFPEGHPHIHPEVLNQAMAAKVDFARTSNLQLSIVTQFCFRAEPIISWLRRLRARGIDVPVRIGLAGPAGLMTLARYAVRCGIGNSIHVLRENSSFGKVLTERGPELIVREIVALNGEASGRSLGIAGFHFYTFGGLNKTLDWIDAELSVGASSAHA